MTTVPDRVRQGIEIVFRGTPKFFQCLSRLSTISEAFGIEIQPPSPFASLHSGDIFPKRLCVFYSFHVFSAAVT